MIPVAKIDGNQQRTTVQRSNVEGPGEKPPAEFLERGGGQSEENGSALERKRSLVNLLSGRKQPLTFAKGVSNCRIYRGGREKELYGQKKGGEAIRPTESLSFASMPQSTKSAENSKERKKIWLPHKEGRKRLKNEKTVMGGIATEKRAHLLNFMQGGV